MDSLSSDILDMSTTVMFQHTSILGTGCKVNTKHGYMHTLNHSVLCRFHGCARLPLVTRPIGDGNQ